MNIDRLGVEVMEMVFLHLLGCFGSQAKRLKALVMIRNVSQRWRRVVDDLIPRKSLKRLFDHDLLLQLDVYFVRVKEEDLPFLVDSFLLDFRSRLGRCSKFKDLVRRANAFLVDEHYQSYQAQLRVIRKVLSWDRHRGAYWLPDLARQLTTSYASRTEDLGLKNPISFAVDTIMIVIDILGRKSHYLEGLKTGIMKWPVEVDLI